MEDETEETSQNKLIDTILNGIGKQSFFEFYNGQFAEFIQAGKEEQSKMEQSIREKIDHIFGDTRLKDES